MNEQFGSIQEQGGPMDNGQSKHFGNYDLVRRIDVGGMGEVYLARQRTAFGREVAIKIIRSDLAYDLTARKRFLREAEVSAHLKHEHILSLIEFSEVDGRLFLVTPYIKGGTLARRLQQGPLPLIEVYQLFSALVQAVSYIHKRGVVHRDLKPSNVLLDQEEDSGQIYVRLIDFGIASISGAPASESLTMAGYEMGTIAYMAPERLNGIAAPSNDIYSLGVILHQMLTGKLPIEEDDDAALPQSLAYLVRRCLLINPAERFVAADELLQAFEYAYRSLSTALRSIPATPSYPSQPLSPPLEVEHSQLSKEVPARTGDWQEQVFVHRGELSAAPLPLPRSGPAFRGEDYNAPTSFFSVSTGSAVQAPRQLADEVVVTGKHAVTDRQKALGHKKKRKQSLVGLISIGIAAILVLISGISYLIFQASISATVSITPQVRSISKVFTVTASLNQRNIDTGAGLMPATVLTSNQTAQQDGPTSGQAGCKFIIIDCQQAVSFVDVFALAEQLKPGLKNQVAQDLQKQEQAQGVTPVGNIHYNIEGNISANPQVGTPSKTVTVTVAGQGSVEAVKINDARNLAAQMLQQHLDASYVLIGSLTQVGQPVVQLVDGNGNVKIAIPVGGVERYQIPDTELAAIQDHIKGMNEQAARAFVNSHSGLDTNATVIHVSYGDTIPNDVQQIKVVTADPANLPPVQVPAVSSP